MQEPQFSTVHSKFSQPTVHSDLQTVLYIYKFWDPLQTLQNTVIYNLPTIELQERRSLIESNVNG